MIRGLLLLLALSLPAAFARADVAFDGSLGPAGVAPAGAIGSTPIDYLISRERGQTHGSNLFFSFERFSLSRAERAAFAPASGISNVIARVTGGELSRIDGGLASAVSGADLWLVNPSGVVFGAGAQLSMSGALYLSTADSVRFADGTRFDMRGGDPGVLSIASPEAFGFLARTPAPISIDVEGRGLRGRALERMAFVAGDLEVSSGESGEFGFLWAQNGRIDFAAVAPATAAGIDVVVRDSFGVDVLEVQGDWRGGSIGIVRDAVVSTSGVNPAGGLGAVQPGAGDSFFLGGDLLIDDAEVRTLTGGFQRGGDIDIRMSGDVVLRARDGRFAGLQAGTGIVQGANEFLSIGDGGDVRIGARSISLLDGASISTTSLFLGNAGDVSIDASERIEISGRNPDGVASAIFSNTDVSGAGGTIRLQAPRVTLERGGSVVTQTSGAGAGGTIEVDAERVRLASGGRIDSSTRSSSAPVGNGGQIRIRASKSITITGRESEASFSGVTALSQPESTGRGGDIELEAPSIRISHGALVSAEALGAGDGGDVTIRATRLDLSGGAIRASAESGAGGNIGIETRERTRLEAGSEISARANGAGDAGGVTIIAGEVLELDRSRITTESPNANGGDIELVARERAALHESEITTSVGGGEGGAISLDEPRFALLNASRIVARAGAGTGGSISIVAGRFVASADSTVDASSETGIDGEVDIDSPEVDLSSELESLPVRFDDAGELLRGACASRSGAAGSFEVRARGPIVPAPDAPLASDPMPSRTTDDCSSR